MIAEKIKKILAATLKNLEIEAGEIVLEHPADLANGDYSTNIALILAKKLKRKPRDVAETLQLVLLKELAQGEIGISKIEIAGAGFINFYLSPKFFASQIVEIIKNL